MALTEHISDEIFERYARRNSAPAETLRVQFHISACEICRAEFGRIANVENTLAAVRNGFAFDDSANEPEHLPYERLEFFVDGKSDEVEREIIESHLAICGECTKDLADLRLYREIAAAPVTTNLPVAETRKTTFRQKLFAFVSIGSFAPAAAVLLIAAAFGFWFALRQTNDEIAQSETIQIPPVPSPSVSTANSSNDLTNDSTNQNASPPPELSPSPVQTPPNGETLYALNDGKITVNENGKIAGLENFSAATQKTIRESLRTGKVSVSNAADALGGNGGVLMSDDDAGDGVPFALASPVGKVVKENQPVLRWKPLKDAASYTVAVVDDKFRVLEESPKLTATSWKPSKPLRRGANYSWQVTAIKTDGSEIVSPSSPAPQARFRVVEQNLFDDIAKLEKSGKPSALALGVLYAKAGLKPEARREFEKLARANPKSQLARKLLRSVK